MQNLSRRFVIAAAVAGGLLAGPAGAAPGVAAPDDMTLGRATAPVKIVEYASLSCPHCADFHATVFPTLKAKYIDTGRVQFTLKELITPPQQPAIAGFLMARCAGPAKYFSVVDGVFRSQPRWREGQVKPVLVEVAKANGMTPAQVDACLADRAGLDALSNRVRRSVEQDKINSTPSIFVNGKQIGDGGVPTLAQVEAAIAAASKSGRR